ncbi:LysR family transcriptional regulator [Lysinibacillus endophyticus]|mgnify:CR=1 FL=1|uniref:LysR family transcriptional regulator n=1 Tax=Ureibacillus endophyticus TaxID=1978490 RepID=UPI0014733A2E|nr:LysR family transcriptional regulator [Lysinibacillus endophyticus]
MEINDLQIFLKVAECSSISKAAEELGYVQPNVSERVKKLEEELGVPLFIRNNRGVEILPAGEIVQNYGKKLISLIEEMKGKVQSEIEIYNIGTTQSIAKNYLEKKFAENDTICSLYVESNSTLKKLLENNEIDMVITYHLFNVHSIKKVHQMKENIILLKSIHKKDINLQTETFFVSRDNSCPFRQHTLQYIQDNALLNSQVVEIDSLNIILAMVSSQKGIAFLPESSLDDRFEIISDSAPKAIDINFYVRNDSSKSIPNFLIS